jgi:hypothetical protein
MTDRPRVKQNPAQAIRHITSAAVLGKAFDDSFQQAYENLLLAFVQRRHQLSVHLQHPWRQFSESLLAGLTQVQKIPPLVVRIPKCPHETLPYEPINHIADSRLVYADFLASALLVDPRIGKYYIQDTVLRRGHLGRNHTSPHALMRLLRHADQVTWQALDILGD